jgi:hypothetical protein
MPAQKPKTKAQTRPKPRAKATAKPKARAAKAQSAKPLAEKAKRDDVQDFVARYDEGPPAEGISDEETLRHHAEIAAELSPDEYQEAATQSFERMDPGERSDFGRRLRRQAEAEGIDVHEAARDDALGDPNILGSLAGMLQDKKPGALSELLGSESGPGVGGILNSPAARAALGGIAAMAAKRLLK